MEQYVDNCLDYNKHGCYCGKGRSGQIVHPIDGCCHKHDVCYSQIKYYDSCEPPYKYQFDNGKYGKTSSFCVLNLWMSENFEC